MKQVTAAMLVTAILTTASVVFAQRGDGLRDGERMRQRRAHLEERLDLTDRQEIQIKRLRLDLERKQAQVQSKIRLARLDIKEAYLAETIDRTAIEKHIKQVSDLQHQTKMNLVDFWFSVNTMLDAAQQKIWKKHVEALGNTSRGALHNGMRIEKPFMREHQGRETD